ncbi:MAG TPA: DUF6049 family protein [Pseudolysinimonas sp.]
MTRLRHSIGAAAAGCALLAGSLWIASPASGADAPPAHPGDVTTAAVTPGEGPVSVAIVMPLTVPPTVTGLLDAETLEAYTAPDGILTRQLDAVAGTSVAIGLDPMVTASIRVLGEAAPDAALAFLDRLRTASNEVFLLSYADADPIVAAEADGGDALAPLGFDFAIDPADFGPAATPTPTPTENPDPQPTEAPDDGNDTRPPLPTTEDLLAWPTTLESIAWPAEGTVDADGLATLADLGFADVLMSGANVSPVSTALVDLGDVDGLVTDDEVTAAVRDAVYATTPTGYQGAVSRLGTTLQARAAATPGRTIIATLDRRWPSGSMRVSDVLTAIGAASASQVVTLGEVLAGPRGGAQLVEADPDAVDERVDATADLVDAAADEAGFLAIAEDATVITQPRRLALLGLSATGWRADGPRWTVATHDFLTASRATLDAVQIAEGSDLLLLSDVSSLRMQVSNALPVAVTVYLSVRPLRPILHVKDSLVEVTIEPDSTSNTTVPVESIANGDVTVRAELRGANGAKLGHVRFVKVILQAGWETAGTLIAASLVVAVFGIGIVRVILRRRRRAGVDGSDDAGTPDD